MDLPSDRFSFPSVSLHGVHPWQPVLNEDSHILCVLFSGSDQEQTEQDTVYLAINTYWEPCQPFAADLPFEWCWQIAVNTGRSFPALAFSEDTMPEASHTVLLGERSVILFVAKRRSV